MALEKNAVLILDNETKRLLTVALKCYKDKLDQGETSEKHLLTELLITEEKGRIKTITQQINGNRSLPTIAPPHKVDTNLELMRSLNNLKRNNSEVVLGFTEDFKVVQVSYDPFKGFILKINDHKVLGTHDVVKVCQEFQGISI